jgi:hypothetical protein
VGPSFLSEPIVAPAALWAKLWKVPQPPVDSLSG